jgi:RNase E specificity factor CsrD
MKLSTQINLGLFFIILFAGVGAGFVEVYQTKAQAERSAKVLTQNTATQLATQLSALLPKQTQEERRTDDELVSTIMTVALINEKLSSISIENAEGTELVKKVNSNESSSTSLFTDVIVLPTAQSQAAIASRSTIVKVTSSSQTYYSSLWQQLLKIAVLCVAIYLLSLLAVNVITKRATRPLSKVTKKLNEIQNNDFTPSSINSATSDFRYLVSAANNLSLALENKFQELTRQAEQFKSVASKDTLTKIANRNAFDRHMKALIGGISGPKEHAITLVRLAQLSNINHKLGMLAGDNYVCGVADILKKASQDDFKGAFVFRISGGDFAIISDVQPKDVHEENLALISKSFTTINPLRDGNKATWIGVARFTNSMSMKEIMESADSALMAATKRPQGWQFASDIAQVHSNAQWRQRLEYVVSQQYADILIQPVMNLERNTPSYYETFARFKDKQTNDIIPMSQLIPASERLDLIPQVDKLVASIVFKKLKVTSHQVAVNISNASIANTEFREWLIQQLSEHETLCHRIIFEIQDAALIHYNEEAISFCKRVTQLGCRITVEHFGDNFASLSGLRAIQPAYVKLSGRLTESIHTNKDNQLFVSSLLNIARSLNIKVIAEKVENEAESVALNNLDIIHQQGYYFAKPTLWTVY